MPDYRGKFPKSVPIFGYRVPVVWKDDLEFNDNGQTISVYGAYYWEAPRPKIEMHSGQSYDMAINTFAHEVLHAWVHATGIVTDDAVEEVTVRTLTPLLVQLLKEWKKYG
jgi:hypothetical protein